MHKRIAIALFLFASAAHAATLHVAPAAALRDESLTELRVTGLAPQQRVTLVATSNDLVGGPWTSSSQFVADGHGVVDVGTQKPVSGAYSSRDIMGPVWTLNATSEASLGAMLLGAAPVGTFTIDFDVRDESGTSLATSRITRTSGNVTRELWSPLGYEMALFYPSDRPARQTVVHITGSGGGRLEGFCEMLAARGYFAACVPYFGMPGTPDHLVEVPLEHFSGAIEKVLEHEKAVGDEVVFSGVSIGGEGSMLVSSTFPHLIKAALGFVPGDHVWEGEIPPFTESRSAWTLGGAPVPHLPLDWNHLLKFNPTFPWTVTPTYQYSLHTASQQQREAARIPVEKIDGPVFLASGTHDAIWESALYADRIRATLIANNHPHRVVHYKANGAGHLVFNPAWTPVPTTVYSILESGGTIEATAAQNAKMWRELLAFLDAL